MACGGESTPDRKSASRGSLTGSGFALPWIVGVVLLTLLPMAASALLSFTRWDGLAWGDIEWVGLGNYRRLVGIEADVSVKSYDPWYFKACLPGRPEDPLFYQAVYNTVFYSLLAVPCGLAAALLLALLLDTRLRGMAVFRTLYYLPHVLSGVATVMVWSWLFNPRFGWVNAVIRAFYRMLDPVLLGIGMEGTAGWPTPDWLYSSAACKPALIIMHIWSAGGAMLIFLAALQSIPASLYEAATVDGAGRWRRFRAITLPQITPAVYFNLVVGIVYSLQSFSHAYLLRNRAQENGLLFYVLYLYQCAFEEPHQLGYASAMAWALFAVLMLLTLLVARSSRWWVHYEGGGVL
ncbi:MAG: sugar ABC transporter permease [Phycisphaerae bacterium]|nr:sugar ABC transporter permease [Phycisphaerae bacterium]